MRRDFTATAPNELWLTDITEHPARRIQLDNAVIESFWGSMQIELLNRQRLTIRIELSMSMIDWID